MWLSDLSIKRPVFITMVVLALSVVGYIFFTRMPVDLFPNVSIPVIAVRTVYAGTSPSEVETLLSKPIEEAVSTLSNVEMVRSQSQESVSLVLIEYSFDYPIATAAEDVRQKLASIRSTLPADAQDPEVLRFDPSSTPILTFAIADKTGKLTADDLRQLADDKLVSRIERTAGVGAVELNGGRERQIHVDLALDRIRAQGLSIQSIIAAIGSENLNVPGGRLIEGGREKLIRTIGEFSSLDQIGAVQLNTPLGGRVFISDIATITNGFEDERSVGRLDGKTSVLLSIQKQSGTNTIKVADSIKAELAQIEAEYPNLQLTVGADQSLFTRESTFDVLISLLIGAGLAALIVLLFFRDIRNTLVTIAGLPVIVLGTFIITYSLGFSMNMIMLLGLSLSIGMLIDDAIVVRENIFRHMEMGEDPKVAASRGTGEIALAVVATTLTIVAVFAPIGFTPGIAGKFMREFGITVAVAVLLSLFEAFTLAPMLSAYFFHKLPPKKAAKSEAEKAASEEGQHDLGVIERSYRWFLGLSLRARPVVVLVGAAAIGASIAMVPLIGQSFVSDFDQGELAINLEMPAGTTLAEMDASTMVVEAMISQQPQTKSVFTLVGATSLDPTVEKATIRIKLKGPGMIKPFIAQVRPLLNDYPGVKASVDVSANTFVGMMTPSATSARSRPFQVSVQGGTLEEVDRASVLVMNSLKRIPGVVDVDRSIRAGRPELQIIVDRARAADFGVSTAQVGATVRALVNGQSATKYRQGDTEMDVIVRLRPEDRDRATDLRQAPLLTPKGALVPLEALTTLTDGTGPSSIERRERQREVLVGSNYEGRELGEITNEAKAILPTLDLPPGVTVKVTGTTRYMEEAFNNLTLALGLSVLFIYVVLASQFESFIHPFTIMLALPLSFVGALAALLITGKTLDMMALIGIILLMGLVTKNSILLVDFTNQLKGQGLTTREAILLAGPIRLRPILMTTLSMIFGMLPIALGYGAGAELRMPMGIAVVGGLLTSTLLTLIVVPVAYTLIDDLTGLFRRNKPKAQEATEPQTVSPA